MDKIDGNVFGSLLQFFLGALKELDENGTTREQYLQYGIGICSIVLLITFFIWVVQIIKPFFLNRSQMMVCLMVVVLAFLLGPWGPSFLNIGDLTVTSVNGPDLHIYGGQSYIEIGSWRLGDHLDTAHFLFATGGKPAVIFRSDATVHVGSAWHYDGGIGTRKWHVGTKRNSPPDWPGVIAGPGYIEFAGVWRLGVVGTDYLSLGHKSGDKHATVAVWRSDGSFFPGPRNEELSPWVSQTVADVKVGYKSIQIGNFIISESFLPCVGVNRLVIANTLTKKAAYVAQAGQNAPTTAFKYSDHDFFPADIFKRPMYDWSKLRPLCSDSQ
jgi:hypothetical protein